MKVLYDNGALKIFRTDLPFAAFRLSFDCGGIKKTLFLTDGQVAVMQSAQPQNGERAENVTQQTNGADGPAVHACGTVNTTKPKIVPRCLKKGDCVDPGNAGCQGCDYFSA